ncbi:MAG: hypothetical protein E4G97_02820 [Deltaproteobacteria bacterium]|nr:MAG: hypothetical protein E4G97_02820 [Deltaproteobacteria bacterium]
MAMKDFRFKEVDKGINRQLPSSMVHWSTGRNVRFKPGIARKTPGKAFLKTVPGALPVRDAFTFIGTDGALRTIVCCDTAIYAYTADFASYSDITPTITPTGGADNVWEFALVGGLPILSNGKNAIWKWAAYNTILTPLTGAPTYGKRICNVLHRLVVWDISESGYTYTGRVRWTEPGDPENWTIDSTDKAGYFDIMGYNTGVSAMANIKAQIASGARLFCFTERGLWVSDFAQVTKQFFEKDPEAEILASRAVCRLKGHVYWLGKKDIHRSQGEQTEDIGLPIRDELFDHLNASYLHTAFAFPMLSEGEVWFCVATGSNTVPDTAFVFNEELKNWTILDIDFTCQGEAGILGLTTDIIGTANGDILRLDSGNNAYASAVATAIEGVIETGDMDFDFPNNVKKVCEIIPDLEVQDEVSELLVQVGVRNRLADDIKWSDPVPFTIGASERCDMDGFRREGKWVRVRFYSNQLGSPWALNGFTIKYSVGGNR